MKYLIQLTLRNKTNLTQSLRLFQPVSAILPAEARIHLGVDALCLPIRCIYYYGDDVAYLALQDHRCKSRKAMDRDFRELLTCGWRTQEWHDEWIEALVAPEEDNKKEGDRS